MQKRQIINQFEKLHCFTLLCDNKATIDTGGGGGVVGGIGFSLSWLYIIALVFVRHHTMDATKVFFIDNYLIPIWIWLSSIAFNRKRIMWIKFEKL